MKRVGILFQPGALWLGAHYSRHDRRWCINLLPCLTVWIVLKGGRPPKCVQEVPETKLVVTKEMVRRANERVIEKGALARFRERRRALDAGLPDPAQEWRNECDRVARSRGVF